jgi:hypothetical protein
MRRPAALAGLLAALALALGAGAAAEPARKGRMPLDAGERAVAREGARVAFEQRLGRALGDGRREILRVERKRGGDKARGAARRARAAEVWVYDYDENVARRVSVRLPGGEVEGFEDLPGVQPPLSRREIDRALAIAYADPRVRARIQDLVRARTGEARVDPSQLHSKAIVFHARSNPIGLSPAAARCGEHRCAQLLLFTEDRFAVEVIPIVDLSEGTVVQVADF